MHLFRNLPIRRKLVSVILLSSMVTLVLASAAVFTFQWLYTRQLVTRDLATQAEIIAGNSTAALSFENSRDATETLAALKTKPHLLSACLYLPDGKLLAHFGAEEDRKDLSLKHLREGFYFQGPDLLLLKPVWLDRKQIGSLCLRFDFRSMRQERLRPYLVIFGFILPAAFGLAYLLSSVLQGVISLPILELAEAARSVARRKDYSVRAKKGGEDELGLLTDAFNQMLAQIQQQDDALRESEERFRTLFENATIGLYRALPDGQVIMANPVLLRLLDHQSLAAMNPAGIEGRFVDPEDHERLREALSSRGEIRGLECEWKTEKGRHLYVRLSAKTVRDTNGAVQFSEGTVEDVTMRKQAEDELQRLNRELLETSRRAGMAEIATGVLHNVGNVLNSVNVSATLVADRVRLSKVSSVSKVAQLLEKHADDLEGFLGQSEKGKRLPGFLASLAQVLAQEQHFALAELESLRRNIDHIKDIVAMQQSYARVSGVVESVNLVDLVEDAVRMNAAALDRHGVHLAKDYAQSPVVSVEKHKVLQILINLIRNAKYALDDSHRADKLLTLQVGTANDRVQVCVKDNGIGIPPENLTRIFAHGFTTRKHGHGFGLHSSALAAQGMGGSLTAHSGGPGQGATFTMELPLNPPKPS